MNDGRSTLPYQKAIDFLYGKRYDIGVIKKNLSFVRTPLLTPFSFSLSNKNSSTARIWFIMRVVLFCYKKKAGPGAGWRRGLRVDS